eukprot:6722511-Prymnesium_polylepis.1
MPRKSRSPVGSYYLALAMSSTRVLSRTLRQCTSARSRSTSYPRSQIQIPCASSGGGAAQRHARSSAVWPASCVCAGGGADSMRRR